MTTLEEALSTARSAMRGEITDTSVYRTAIEYLVDNRAQLKQPIYIALPGGMDSNKDSEWAKVREGSEERCNCGNERVIMPLNQRTDYEAARESITLDPGTSVYLKPVGGDKESAYMMVEIRQHALTFFSEPFAPLMLSMDLFSTPAYKLAMIADAMVGQEEPPIMRTGKRVPLFAINDIDVHAQRVTITLDKDVEAFDPAVYADRH